MQKRLAGGRGSVGQDFVGRVGDNAVVGGNTGHDGFPQGDVVLTGDEVGLRADGGPGLLLDFVLELIFPPAGIAGEGPHDGVGLIPVGPGFIGRDPRGKSEAGISFPEGGEGELVAGDGTPEVDIEISEVGKFRAGDEIANFLAGRMIQNEAKRSFRGSVIGEENDGLIEMTIAQSGGGKKKPALEPWGDRVGVHTRKMDGEVRTLNVEFSAIDQGEGGWE